MLLTIICSCLAISFAAEAAPPVVYGIAIDGTIEPGLAEIVKRGLREARSDGAQAILLEINTFGGRVDAATEIRDQVMASPIPVIGYVTERAWSAGALIALASHHLAMAPASSIGAAEPRPAEEKTIAALRSEFEATAQGHGRDPKVAAAMVDKDVVVEGLVEQGKILSLSATDAREIGFVDLVVGNRAQLLEELDLADAAVVWVQATWAEKLARFVTEPMVSSGLLTLGFLGLMLELFSAGFGIPGSIGLAALGLFFGGRMVAGLAGAEVVILFAAGLVLLGIEVFAVPGFGVLGLGGIVSIVASIVLSYNSATAAAYSLIVAIVLSVVLFMWLSRYFRRSKTWNKLVLKTNQEKSQGYVGLSARQEMIGQKGVTLTACRPAGTVLVGHNRLDAVSEGPYIVAGEKVVVVGRSGAQVVIRQDNNPIDEGEEA